MADLRPRRWTHPRAEIATIHKDNDFAYAYYGMGIFAKVNRTLGWTFSDWVNKDVLDFGCGTGVATRVFGMFTLGLVVGYDPTPECIEEARKEEERSKVQHQCAYTTSLPGRTFDLVVCAHVFEHLNEEEELKAMGQIWGCLKPTGIAVIWYKASRNRHVARGLRDALSGNGDIRVGVWNGKRADLG